MASDQRKKNGAASAAFVFGAEQIRSYRKDANQMFKITALLAVLLLAFATPVFADSIPPPVTNLPMTGMVVSGFGYWRCTDVSFPVQDDSSGPDEAGIFQ